MATSSYWTSFYIFTILHQPKTNNMKKILTYATLFIATSADAQSFTSSPFYNAGGAAYQQNWNNADGGEVVEMLEQPDGKVITCGYNYNFGCNCYHIQMFRVDACGSIDSSFGTNGRVDFTFDQRNSGYDFALQADGKIIVAGSQAESNAGSQQKPFIARFKPDGEPDSSFGTFGTSKIVSGNAYSEFTYLLPLPNGKYLCQNGNYIMRFNSNGSVDNSFGTGGMLNHPQPSFVPWSYSYRSVQRGDGKIISVGCSVGFSSHAAPLFLCTDTLGKIDSTYGTNGYFADGSVPTGGSTALHLFVQSDNKIIGIMPSSPNADTLKLSRYLTNGSLDLNYGVNGRVAIAANTIRDAKMLSNNSIILYSASAGIPHQFHFIDVNGNANQNFKINGSSGFVFSGSVSGQKLYFKNDHDMFIASYENWSAYIGRYTTYPTPAISQSGNLLSSNYTEAGSTYQWYLNGNALPNTNDSVYTAMQTGIYDVKVTNTQGCTYIATDTITNIPTAIHAPGKRDHVSMFPNPASDQVTISNTLSVPLSITVYDMSGRKLITTTGSSKHIPVSIQQLNAGIYLVEVNDGEHTLIQKLIKQ
jgi:uncharacterized delta-60 repeat protein